MLWFGPYIGCLNFFCHYANSLHYKLLEVQNVDYEFHCGTAVNRLFWKSGNGNSIQTLLLANIYILVFDELPLQQLDRRPGAELKRTLQLLGLTMNCFGSTAQTGSA